MNCRFCGQESAPNSAFCGNCGSHIEPIETPPAENLPTQPPTPHLTPVKKAVSSRLKALIGIGIGATLALILAIGVVPVFVQGFQSGFENAQEEVIANTPLTYDEFVVNTGFTTVSKEECKPFVAKAKATKVVLTAKKRMKSLNKADGDSYAAYKYVAGHDWVTTPSETLDNWASEWNVLVSDFYDSVGTKATNYSKIAVSKETLTPDFENQIKVDCGIVESFAKTETTLSNLSVKATEVTTLADTRPWYPKGYREWEDGLAWKWADAYEDCYSCRYNHIRVISRSGCAGGVYAEVNFERGGSVVDWTNDTVPYLGANSKALMTFRTWSDGNLSTSLTKLTCNTY